LKKQSYSRGRETFNASAEVRQYFRERFVVFAGIVIDCFYIGIWVVSVWLTDKFIISPFLLKGVDKIALDIFQIASGGGTLMALLAFTIKDLWVLCVRLYFDTIRETRRIKRGGK
jgi:hypothetical protein